MTAEPASRFEVSWEVCHDVGSVHTAIVGRAEASVQRSGDLYVAVGPWLLSEGNAEKVLEPESQFDAFGERCRAAGVPVRVGRWRIPGRPRTVLVEFSGLYAKKDQILETLWDRHHVDSLLGGWDYVEPVLFGHAAGIVVERWLAEFGRGPAVARFHEWMAGAGLLHLRTEAPHVGTVFTAHTTALDRAIAATGKSTLDGLEGRTPVVAATAFGIGGKHSMEGACAREADVLTAVSSATSDQMLSFHGRKPEFLLPDGLDDAIAKAAAAAAARPPEPRASHRFEVRAATRPVKPSIFPLEVTSVVPAALAGLEYLSRNWRFTWDRDIASLFEDLSPATWAAVRGNPVRVLHEAPTGDLDARAKDPEFCGRLADVVARTENSLRPAVDRTTAPSIAHPVAYVCAEYGIHESLPIYSGGLGVLAGDHLRAASDLGVPLVAVGLLYRKGYMRQRLQGGVEQLALVDEIDPRRHALTLVRDADGAPVEVPLNLPGTTLHLRAWRADVGRVPLYLLDADFDANRAEDRTLTHALYGGDAEYRVRQEIVLGRGGVRLLKRLGIEPCVYHVNEGHGAFAVLERAAQLVREANLTFDEAHEAVRSTTAFTTHTPVPAGHDVFDEGLMRRYFSDAPESLGLSWERFFSLGASSDEPGFNMTHLALRFASFVNGVSRRHGEVSQGLLRSLCPHLAVEEVPIVSVTNGVHLAAWTSGEIARLVGPAGRPVSGADFARAESLDDGALWAARCALRQRLLGRVALELRQSFQARHDSPALLARTLAGLSPDALYIGFARRFATYKRADLVLRDKGRLRAILEGEDRPVRLLLAGKAHPRDHAAKALLGKVARLARSDEFVGRVVVLENYDMALARTLVQGVDVWMNNPRPPLEASGTSGMKAAANGALNLSVADGWWIEAYSGANGWVVGNEHPETSESIQDEVDAASLYRLLEEQVIPLFFRRDAKGVPREWLDRVRRSLATIPPVFDSARMVAEYRVRAYEPLARRFVELSANRHEALRLVATRAARLAAGIAAARIVSVALGENATVGRPSAVRVDVQLGALAAAEVAVELVVGRRSGIELRDVSVVPLEPESTSVGVTRRFGGSFVPRDPGSFGYLVRVRPHGPVSLHDPAVWA